MERRIQWFYNDVHFYVLFLSCEQILKPEGVFRLKKKTAHFLIEIISIWYMKQIAFRFSQQLFNVTGETTYNIYTILY